MKSRDIILPTKVRLVKVMVFPMVMYGCESWHPCLVPDFRGNAFNFSPLMIMFAVGLSYIAFIMLRCVPSNPAFWRVLNHKWMLTFVKGILCIY